MERPGTTMDPGISRFPCQRKYRQPYRAAGIAGSSFSPLPTFPIAAAAQSPPSHRQQEPPAEAKSGRAKKIQPADYNPANGYGTAARTLIKKFNIIFCRVFVFYVLL